mmetsp:Transcript_964/g.1634  ORF Transcript_964/g.1634 Transcript_964/m.1634 type:complete len:264 (+) Transcript_964:110-901(+)
MTDAAVIVRIQHAHDHYEVLGLTREASSDDVKRAYRAFSLKVHPDRNPQHGAEAAFKLVGEAHAILSDAQERAAYDRQLDTQSARSSKPRGKPERARPKCAKDEELERQLDAELEELRRREWIEKARGEQYFLIKTCHAIAVFCGVGVFLFITLAALPGSSDTTATGSDGWLRLHLVWLCSFVGRFVGSVLGLITLLVAIPFALWAFLAGMGKLCGWFFDACELIFSRIVTPLIEEYILKGPGVPRRSTQSSVPRRGKRPGRR